MKAYKASYNGKCETLTYEVGKTYMLNGLLRLCKRGFHCCKKLEEVFGYYNRHRDDLVIFEVEVLGSVIEADDKLVTNKLKIVRILDKDEYKAFVPIKEYDKNGNLIHYRHNANLEEEWYEYDQNNNEIYYKSSGGYEEWKKFDQNNNLVHYRDKETEWSIIIE